jgi:peptidoglycan/LPS O-acetylase OafA/YrhL
MHNKYESYNLDFLRSVAVCLVFGRHLIGRLFELHGPDSISLQLLGILGVWFFFVHTSLVLMFSLQKQARTLQGLPLYLSFILRRAFRIFPLSIATILLVYTTASVWEDNPVVSISELTGPVVVSNLFLVQNLFNLRDVIGPLWSLPIELQMYLLLPFLWKIGKNIGWKWLTAVVWPLAVIAAILAALATSISWLGVVKYAPCFIPGIICYLMWTRIKRTLPALALPILLAALLGTYIVLGRISQTGGAWIICLALGTTLPWIGEIKSLLLRTVCSTIAKYSYGIYLFHDFCIPIVQTTIGKGAHWTVIVIVSILSTASLSFFAYHTIEEPLIRLGSKISSRFFGGKHPEPAR